MGERNDWRQRQVISNLKIKLNLTKSQKHKQYSKKKTEFSAHFKYAMFGFAHADLLSPKNNDVRHTIKLMTNIRN